MKKNVIGFSLLIFVGIWLVFFSLYIGSNQVFPNALFLYIVILIFSSLVVAFASRGLGTFIEVQDKNTQQEVKSKKPIKKDFKKKK